MNMPLSAKDGDERGLRSKILQNVQRAADD